MARASKELALSGYLYTVQQLPATRAYKLLHRLGRALAPAAARAAGAAQGLSLASLLGIDVAALAPALESVFDRLSEEQLEGVIKELFNGAVVQGEGVTVPYLEKREVFDDHFAGRMTDLFKVAAFALKANYDDFLGELLSAIASHMPVAGAATPKSESPTS
jgi:hypothetical protein